ncbi:hypothetical protein I5907_15315 [Panacibacter sp. DH6]|uniref:Outer membrane protein beta-barrel domain-containing protein n=1 Tax=Panacibacter microcysteis TaxID=2793269 RepID=A0A931E5V3_9BACT|nr:hypothetical protein [Panacibacter microcysteis]MBG9377613.1 hypothetical protein [Panacibacter microcysteis]
MSEDLRYYFFDNEPDDQPPVSADEGWNSMRQLLDAEMPVSSKRTKRRFAFWVASVVVGTALVLFTIQSRRDDMRQQVTTAAANNTVQKAAGGETQKNTPNTNGVEQNSSTLAVADGAKASRHGYTNQEGESKRFIPVRRADEPDRQMVRGKSEPVTKTPVIADPGYITQNTKINDGASTDFKRGNEPAAKDLVSNETNTQENAVVDKTENTQTQQVAAKKNTTGKNTHAWQYSVGAGMNFSLSNISKGLQPYPVIEVKYKVSPVVFVSGGLALFSPVSTNTSGVKKTVYINDTSSDVSRYNETLNFKRLYYADLSLQAGIHFTKRMSFSAGLQASRLLSSKSYTTLEPYDFNSDRVALTDVGTLIPTPSAAPVYSKQVDVRKIDIRYTAGLNYDLNKLSVGLQYQGGVKPLLSGEAVKGDKASLLTFKFTYRIK